MFLHLGGDCSVLIGDVISIHDYKQLKSSEEGKAFLKKREKIRIGGKIKSAVVTDQGIYLSVLSPETLKKRADSFLDGLSLYRRK